MAHQARIPCPKCGYDLLGLVREDSTARCPECGRTSSLGEIAGVLQRRSNWWQGPLAFLLVFAALGFSNTLALSGGTFGLHNFIFAALMAAIAYILSIWWLDLLQLERLIFALGALLIALLDSRWMYPWLLTLWFVGFWTYSFLSQWRQIGDRW